MSGKLVGTLAGNTTLEKQAELPEGGRDSSRQRPDLCLETPRFLCKTGLLSSCGDLDWGFAERGAAGAARRCLTSAGFLSYRLDETERKGSGRSRSA